MTEDKKPIKRQVELLPAPEDELLDKDEMSLAEIETLLVRKHRRLALTGEAGAPKAIDQLMKIKELIAKQEERARETEMMRVKPAVLVIPVFPSYEKWKEIAAKQQEELISETQEL